MKDKVFIIWSGNDRVAHKVKDLLEQQHNYLCFVGGNVDSGRQMLSIGDTVINQMRFCNQAIVIFENKAEGRVSSNLFFELGFVISEYGMRKVHCVKHSGDRIELPSDFDNSFVADIDGNDTDAFARNVVAYFLGRQKLSIVYDKMELITQRYKMHDMIQAHYSDMGSKCSDYELAQYILFYMQAAVMFQDDAKILDELMEFKKRYNTKFSKEINLAVAMSIALLRVQVNLVSENGMVYIGDETFRSYFSGTKDLLDDITTDDSGIFDEWAKVMLTENIAYASSLYSQNPGISDSLRKYARDNVIHYGEKCLAAIDSLISVNEKSNNNDEMGLITVFRAYMARHLYTAYMSLDAGKAREWLMRSLKEWKTLLSTFGDNSIDSKLFENFEMEYFLTLIDYLKFAGDEINEFEKVMYWADIDEFIARNEKKNNIHSYVKKIMEQRAENKG